MPRFKFEPAGRACYLSLFSVRIAPAGGNPKNRDFTYFRYLAYRADPIACPDSIFDLFYIPAVIAALFYMVFEIGELGRILYTIWEK